LTLTESDIEKATLSGIASLGYTVILYLDHSPGELASYLEPLPKFISCEIMTNDVKIRRRPKHD
jgi:hypothetical protein